MRTRNRSTHSDAAARADDLVHFDLGVGKRSLETIDQGFHALTPWVLTGSERNVLPILGDGFVEQLGLALERFVEGFDSGARSEAHTSELQSLMRISYAVFCLKKKNTMITSYPLIYYTTQRH